MTDSGIDQVIENNHGKACLDGVFGIRTGATGDKIWKAKMNPLSYGGPQSQQRF